MNNDNPLISIRSKDIDGRGFSKTTQITENSYVVPTKYASEHYPNDYILNVYNYGIMFDDGIHWYEIGTGTPVLKTAIDPKIYEVIASKHGLLIRQLNNLGVDIIPEGFRKDPKNYSKQAIKDEEATRAAENVRMEAEFKALMAQLEQLTEERLSEWLDGGNLMPSVLEECGNVNET